MYFRALDAARARYKEMLAKLVKFSFKTGLDKFNNRYRLRGKRKANKSFKREVH